MIEVIAFSFWLAAMLIWTVFRVRWRYSRNPGCKTCARCEDGIRVPTWCPTGGRGKAYDWANGPTEKRAHSWKLNAKGHCPMYEERKHG